MESIPPSSNVPVKLMEQYILTGDRTLLAQVPSVKTGTFSWDGHLLAGALARVADWTEEDRRVLHLMFARNLLPSLSTWLNGALRQEKTADDIMSAVRAELESCNAAARDIVTLFSLVQAFAREGKPNSAGRYVLGLSDSDLQHAIEQHVYGSMNLYLIEFLLDFAPERMPALFPVLLRETPGLNNNASVAGLMLRKGGKRFEQNVHAFFRSMRNNWHRFQLGQEFFAFDPVTYRREALEAARASLASPPLSNNHGPVGEWMVETFGKEVLPDLVDYLARESKGEWWKPKIVAAVARTLKQESLPALQAALKTNNLDVALATLPYMIALRDDSQDALILQTLHRGFEDKLKAVRFITLSAQWKPSLVADSLSAL